jgi:hypothetical protein
MSQVTVTLVFASIAEAAAALATMGKPALATANFVTPADSKPTAAAVQPPAAAPEKKVEPSVATPKAAVTEPQATTPVDPAALATALQNFAKRDNAAFGALMKQHSLKNMAAVTEAKHLHAVLMAAATNA